MKKILIYPVLILAFLLEIVPAVGQLSGTYTIGSGQNFTDIASAIAELHSEGIDGPVIFNIIPGTYTVHVTLNQVIGSSETNTITFQSSTLNRDDVILQYSPTDDSDNWVFLVDGADYINFRYLTFKALGESLYSTVLFFDGFSSHISIENNAFYGKYTTSGFARNIIILVNADNKNTEAFNYFSIQNNYFRYGSYAIFLEAPNDNYMQGNIVDGNIFEETGYCCVYCNFCYAPQVCNNTMEAVSYGLRVSGDYGGGRYCGNSIYSENNGMSIQRYGNIGGGRALIANNFVTIGSSGDYGITIVNSIATDVVNNSVYNLSKQFNSTAFYSAYGVNTYPTVTVTNNNFSCEHNGYAVYVLTENVISGMSNNNMYTAGNYVASWAGELCFDLAQLQERSGLNENSLSVYPHYASETDLHTVAPWLDNRGVSSALISEDIDGDTRNNPPDIGADEFSADPATTVPLDGSVEYTIGPGGVYGDFQSAMDDALLRGISAPVVYGFLEGTFEGPFEMKRIPGSGDANRVTIQSASGNSKWAKLRYSASGTDDNFVFRFYGADFITLKNLVLEANGTQYAKVIDLYQGADSICIENDSIIAPPNTNATTNLTLIFSMDSDFRSREIKNNTLVDGSYGIYMRREQNNFRYPEGCRITGNTIGNTGYSSMYLQFYNAPEILSNTIHAGSKGIQLLTCKNDLRVQKNKIYLDGGDGIYMTSCDGNEGQKGLISNNFIYTSGISKSNGIYMSGCPWQLILNNSIHNTSTHADSRPLSIYSGAATNDMIYNNIFSNRGGDYALFVYSPTMISGCDHNCYYTQYDYLAYWGENVGTLEDLQTINGMDANSIVANPNFFSDMDLHTAEPALDSAAQSFAAVPDDIDGDMRDIQFPDIGADEFHIGPNLPPRVINPIPDMRFEWNSGPCEIAKLDTVFDDPEGEPLSFAAVTDVNWLLPLIQDGILTLAPGEGASGLAVVIVSATDPLDAFVTDTFSVEFFIPPNHAPVAVDDTLVTCAIDTVYVLLNDSDEDGDELQIAGIIYGGNALVSITGDKLAVVYDANGFAGNDTVQYIVKDPMDATDTAKIFIRRYLFMEGFHSIQHDLPGLSHGTIKWGDFDDDGDLDLLQTGWTGTGLDFVTSISKNTGESFVETGIPLLGLSAGTSSSAEWTDFDNDNDLDICVSGLMDNSGDTKKLILYENLGNDFQHYTGFEFDHMTSSSIKWGDVNMDGLADMIASGSGEGEYITMVYYGQGDGGTGWQFIGEDPDIPGTSGGEVSLVDVDADNDLDYFITGAGIDNCKLFINQSGSTEEIETGIPAFRNASTDWADIDLDGDPDLAIMGSSDSGTGLVIYLNNGVQSKNENMFSTYQEFDGMDSGDLEWIDFDLDGDMDLSVTGNSGFLMSETFILVNNDGVFSKVYFGFVGVGRSSLDWGDFDNDGDPDLALQGINTDGSYTLIYRNDREDVNQPPVVSDNLSTTRSGYDFTFTWDAATDDHTPAEALTYNVSIGSTEQTCEILSPMSVNGFLKKPFPGNAGYGTSLTIKDLAEGDYYIRVQAIDQSLSASSLSMPAYLKVTGVEEEQIEGIFVYPVPANDILFIETDVPVISQVRIFDLSGRISYHEEYSGSTNLLEVEVSQLKPGTYILELSGKTFVTHRRISIQ